MSKTNIVAGTGHRLQDLPCGFDRKHPFKLSKLKQLENYLNRKSIDVVISGVALGWDTWLAYTAIKVSIPLWAYVPFKGQECRWSKEHQDQYHKILEKSTKVNYVCEPGYATWKMHKRNEAMISDCDLILSLWNPSKKYGGTWSTVSHAYSINKPILNFWTNPESFVGEKEWK